MLGDDTEFISDQLKLNNLRLESRRELEELRLEIFNSDRSKMGEDSKFNHLLIELNNHWMRIKNEDFKEIELFELDFESIFPSEIMEKCLVLRITSSPKHGT